MLIDLKNLSNLYIAHGNLTTYNNHIVPAPKNLSPQVKHCRLMKGDKQKRMSKFLKDEIVPAVTSYFMYSEIQGSVLIEKSAFIIGEKPEVPESILVVAAVVNLVRFVFRQIPSIRDGVLRSGMLLYLYHTNFKIFFILQSLTTSKMRKFQTLKLSQFYKEKNLLD